MKLSEKEVLVIIGMAILKNKKDCKDLLTDENGEYTEVNIDAMWNRALGTLIMIETILTDYVKTELGTSGLSLVPDEIDKDEVCMFTDENGRML